MRAGFSGGFSTLCSLIYNTWSQSVFCLRKGARAALPGLCPWAWPCPFLHANLHVLFGVG